MFSRLLMWLRDLWIRLHLGRVLKEALVSALVTAVASALDKDLTNPQKVQSAVRRAIQNTLTKMHVDWGHQDWLSDPLYEICDMLIEKYLPDKQKILLELERHLRKRLGV